MTKHLLDHLASKLGTTNLSDLHGAIPVLRFVVERIPLSAYPEKDWLDVAHYLWPTTPCHTANEARELLLRAEE